MTEMIEKKSKMTDMTVGNPYKLLILFSIPLLIGNIFQQLYNMVDSIVVGQAIGEKALAAVGTGFPVIFMMSSLFMGIGIGANIMISQFYGAKDLKQMNKTVGTIYTAMIIGVVPLSLIGVFCSRWLLQLMQVPDDGTLDMATTYMMVVFAGTIGMLGFNINAGILQGLGDSKTSLLFLLIATIVNIVLDLVFVLVFKWGVFGVAFATIIAQIISWVFGIFYINKHYHEIEIKPFKFIFEKDLFKQAMRLGIPTGLQQALFSIGIMMMQALVNAQGSSFMAGFNGANKIDSLAFMPIMSFSTALTTYTGQNIGANKIDRVKQGVKSSMILSVACSIVLGGLVYPFSEVLMKMFNQNPEVIQSGVYYLHSVLPFYSLLAISFMYTAVMRGAGEMMVPMITSFVGLWLARVPAAYIITNLFGPEYMFYSYVVGWVLGVLIAGIYYATGKWKNKSVVLKMAKERGEI